nr:hypothetical protein [Amycolatopsis sp. Hca4]
MSPTPAARSGSLVEQALLGVLDPRTHDRDGIIEATAGWTAVEYRRSPAPALRPPGRRLAQVCDWDQHVDYRDGKLPHGLRRWHTVRIHAVSLGIGVAGGCDCCPASSRRAPARGGAPRFHTIARHRRFPVPGAGVSGVRRPPPPARPVP